MKIILFYFLTACLLMAQAPEPVSSHTKVTSSLGYIAHSFVFGEGELAEGKILIEKNGRIISTIDFASAVSFSPNGKLLLVAESGADDDLQHFLLDFSKGQFKKPGPEKFKRFGGRYISKTVWSEDSKYLVFFTSPQMDLGPPTAFLVSKYL